MSQVERWAKVIEIKLRVHAVIGNSLSHEFRSSQVYQAYTGLCGEAEMAYEDGMLDDQIVELLDETARKVISSWENSAVQ